jgi:hypothetical protein
VPLCTSELLTLILQINLCYQLFVPFLGVPLGPLGEIGAITAAYLMSRVIPDIGPVRRRALPLARDDILPAILPARVVLLSRKTSHDSETTRRPGSQGCPAAAARRQKSKQTNQEGETR